MNDFNKKFYIVYNVLTFNKKSTDSVYPFQHLIDLYSLLLNSSYVVTVENHVSENELKSELRVIFWDIESYNKWADENRKRYDELVDSFRDYHNNEDVKFERYTSLENYISDFPYTDYPSSNNLIDWLLIPYHKDFMIKNILPVGKIQEYLGEGQFESAKNIRGEGSRFIKERTSDIVRRPISSIATKDGNFPKLLAYSFDQTVLTFMYTAPWLYRKLQKLTTDAEILANQYIKDCDNAAVLIGHDSLGSELTLHTHRLSENIRYTFTIAVRLTFNSNGAVCRFYDPLSKQDPLIDKYYSHPNLLYELTKESQEHTLDIKDRASILVFSASMIPHTVEYDQDIFLFYVYDNVTFKPGMFEEVKKLSEISYFQDKDDDARLFYFSYQ
jgi:hypothetical protein